MILIFIHFFLMVLLVPMVDRGRRPWLLATFYGAGILLTGLVVGYGEPVEMVFAVVLGGSGLAFSGLFFTLLQGIQDQLFRWLVALIGNVVVLLLLLGVVYASQATLDWMRSSPM